MRECTHFFPMSEWVRNGCANAQPGADVGAVCGCGWSAVAAGERATLSSRQDFLPTMAPLQHGRRSPPRDWLMRKVSFLKLSSSGCIQAYIEKLSPPKVTEGTYGLVVSRAVVTIFDADFTGSRLSGFFPRRSERALRRGCSRRPGGHGRGYCGVHLETGAQGGARQP